MSGWEKFSKAETSKRKGNKAFVSITSDRITFNVLFVQQAQIEKYDKVTVLINQDEHKLGFIFHNDDTEESFNLYEVRGDKSFSSKGLYRKYEWIKNVVSMPNNDRRFIPKKEKFENEGIYTIQIPSMK